ncbi:MAG: hypothetical protein HDT39_11840 [Lachnospiraceae bacterium]|nr:hypothetical protein [Lachnospiraceae bacterium]
MSDELKGAIITALVTGIISIIGFIMTNVSMKRSFMNELKKQRDDIALEKMSEMPYVVLQLMDKMMEDSEEANDSELECFKEIMNTIYSYGSEKAIELVSLMQKENYEGNANTNNSDHYRIMSLFVLLATQIKYDVTEISVSPELWFQMRMTDYFENKSEIKNANNRLVDELKLKKDFKIE